LFGFNNKLQTECRHNITVSGRIIGIKGREREKRTLCKGKTRAERNVRFCGAQAHSGGGGKSF
jgi:hypothetical protein